MAGISEADLSNWGCSIHEAFNAFPASFQVLARHDPSDLPYIIARAPLCSIRGTAGNDFLIGSSAPDVVCGFGGDDAIDGREGGDHLLGGAGSCPSS